MLLRDELLEREAFDTLLEAKVLIEQWRPHSNTVRLHSALRYRPPGPGGDAATWHGDLPQRRQLQGRDLLLLRRLKTLPIKMPKGPLFYLSGFANSNAERYDGQDVKAFFSQAIHTNE